jgi:hypothetical protein
LDYNSTDAQIVHLQRVEKEHKANMDLFRGEKSLTKGWIKRRTVLRLLIAEFDARYETQFGRKNAELFKMLLNNLLTTLVYRKKRMVYSRHDWQRFTTLHGVDRKKITRYTMFSAYAESCVKGITITRTLEEFWLKYFHLMGISFDDQEKQKKLAFEVMTEEYFFEYFGISMKEYHQQCSESSKQSSASSISTAW